MYYFSTYFSPFQLGPSLLNKICVTICSKKRTEYSCCSVSQLCLTLWPHGLQYARLPCSSSSPRVCWNTCPLSQWCHPTISSSVTPFSSCLQSFPASRSFLRSEFFASGGQSLGVSASVLPMNIQDWFSASRKMETWTLHHKQSLLPITWMSLEEDTELQMRRQRWLKPQKGTRLQL